LLGGGVASPVVSEGEGEHRGATIPHGGDGDGGGVVVGFLGFPVEEQRDVGGSQEAAADVHCCHQLVHVVELPLKLRGFGGRPELSTGLFAREGLEFSVFSRGRNVGEHAACHQREGQGPDADDGEMLGANFELILISLLVVGPHDAVAFGRLGQGDGDGLFPDTVRDVHGGGRRAVVGGGDKGDLTDGRERLGDGRFAVFVRRGDELAFDRELHTLFRGDDGHGEGLAGV